MNDPKTGELSPMLAERWQVSDGGRTWRFHLRKGVQFQCIPGVAIGATHTVAGVGPKVGDWPLIPGHMGFHNWST